MTVSLKREKLTNDIRELASVDDQSGPRIAEEEAGEIADIGASSKKGNTVSLLASKFFSIVKRIFKKKPNAKKSEEGFSSRGFLANKLNISQLFSLPPLILRREFYPFFLPVTSTSIGRVSAYVAMAHVVSSSLGPLSMAAQQIITSVFYCLCPIADSLSLTAQSFVPGVFDQSGTSAEGVEELRRTSVSFLTAGTLFSVLMSAAGLCVPLLGRFFTTDPSVIAQVRRVSPIIAGVFAVHGTVTAAEGVMLGQKDLAFLGRAYAAFFFVVPYLMLRLKKVALAGTASISLNSVWGVFMLYNWVRGGMFLSRLVTLNARRKKQVLSI